MTNGATVPNRQPCPFLLSQILKGSIFSPCTFAQPPHFPGRTPNRPDYCRPPTREMRDAIDKIVPGFSHVMRLALRCFLPAKQWRRWQTGGVERIRNIGIIAHIDAGKTTTTEKMLYFAGHMHHAGSVDHGSTVMDFLPAERERGITIASAAITLPWNDYKINLIDTPGHADFTYEVERAVRVLDGAVCVLDGVAGVEAQTEKVWRQSEAYNVPKLVFVNKMDRAGAGFGRTVREVESELGGRTVVLQIPVFEAERFCGVIDVIEMEESCWDAEGKIVRRNKISDMGEATKAREALVETLAELDLEIVEILLKHENHMLVSAESIRSALARQTRANLLVPVLCGAAARNIGVQPLLDAIGLYLPPPLSTNVQTATAVAFKVVHDQKRGALVYVRVYSGVLKRGTMIHNITQKSSERMLKLLQPYADEFDELQELTAGNIGIIVGLKTARTGDTLASAKDVANLAPIAVPCPVFFAAITSTPSEARHVDESLEMLLREDPSLQVTRENDQILLSGMGELHLEISRNRLRQHYKARCEMGPVKIGYRERILNPVRVSWEHRSQDKVPTTTVTVSLDPSDGALPDNNVQIAVTLSHLTLNDLSNAVHLGITEATARSPVFSYPLEPIRVNVDKIDITPDTNPTAVTEATKGAILQAIRESGTQLMEPVMSVTVSCDDAHLGSVVSDLAGHRAAQVQRLDEAETQVEISSRKVYAPPDSTFTAATIINRQRLVQAIVPLKEMVGYLRALRSMTAGRGSFVMQLKGFEPVDGNRLTQAINSS